MKKQIIFLGLVGLLFTANVVFATTPLPPPDFSWFKVQTEFSTTGLPRGISITKKDYGDSMYQPGKSFIRNQSATPLYLLKKTITDSYSDAVQINVFPESKISSEFVPIYKLISNEVYYPRSTYIDQGGNHDLEGKYYEAEKLADNCDKNHCTICPKDSCDPSVVALDHIPYGLGINSTKNIYQENRPINPVIPEPEDFKLAAYYGNNLVEINGKFVYSLNDNYGNDYGFSRNSENDVLSSKYKTNIIIGAGVIALLGLVYFFIRKFRDVK